MVSYSTNANVQILAFGAANSSLDTKTGVARDTATSMINAKIGLKTDLTTVPDMVDRCCMFLAAGVINPDPLKDYWNKGLLLLENLGDDIEKGDVYKTIAIDGFGRFGDSNHFDTSGFIAH